MYVCEVTSVMSNSLQPHELWCTKAPLLMEFSRQEYWSGLPCPFPGDLPDPGMEPAFLMSTAVANLDKKKADIKILMSDSVDFKIKIIKWKNCEAIID